MRWLCDALIEKTGCQVIVKKLTEEIVESELVLASHAENVPLEDDSIEETILPLNKMFVDEDGQINPAVKRLIRRAKVYEQQGKSLKIVNDIRNVPLAALKRFLQRWPEKYASYIPMVRFLHAQKSPLERYSCMIFLEGMEVKGLYIADRLSFTEVGLYCGVTTRDVSGITEWMDIYYFRILWCQGIKKIYLGGAERQGVAYYIDKLLPQRTPYAVRTGLYKASKSTLSLSIRRATETDVSEIADLYKQAYNSATLLDEHWTKASARKFVTYFYRRQPDLFFIAKENGVLVGAVVAAVQPWWDGNHLVEGELFEAPGLADETVRKALLQELLTVARSKYHVVSWDTITPTLHEHPLSAFEELGFSEVPHWKAISGDINTILSRVSNPL